MQTNWTFFELLKNQILTQKSSFFPLGLKNSEPHIMTSSPQRCSSHLSHYFREGKSDQNLHLRKRPDDMPSISNMSCSFQLWDDVPLIIELMFLSSLRWCSSHLWDDGRSCIASLHCIQRQVHQNPIISSQLLAYSFVQAIVSYGFWLSSDISIDDLVI